MLLYRPKLLRPRVSANSLMSCSSWRSTLAGTSSSWSRKGRSLPWKRNTSKSLLTTCYVLHSFYTSTRSCTGTSNLGMFWWTHSATLSSATSAWPEPSQQARNPNPPSPNKMLLTLRWAMSKSSRLSKHHWIIHRLPQGSDLDSTGHQKWCSAIQTTNTESTSGR